MPPRVNSVTLHAVLARPNFLSDTRMPPRVNSVTLLDGDAEHPPTRRRRPAAAVVFHAGAAPHGQRLHTTRPRNHEEHAANAVAMERYRAPCRMRRACPTKSR
mmetsp:Transcript_61116/g.170967  ORF Transcript_61116/g.170967 Transcript_61116/m.170967 type:complete len:103 (-) Transcript_61116:619-927(-)